MQLLDTLAGTILTRVAAGEHLAHPGEVLLDAAAVTTLGLDAVVHETRSDPHRAGQILDALVRRVQQLLAARDGVLLQVTIGDKGSYLS